MLVPTGGYDLSLQSFTNLGGATVVYLKLEAPNPDEVVNQEPEIKRWLVDLGITAEPRIEILVERSVRRMPGILVFKLAAMLDRDFRSR